MKCAIAVLIGLLALAGNTIIVVGGVAITVPAFIIDAINNLSFVAKKLLEKFLGFEYPWWQPLEPGTIFWGLMDYLKRKFGDFGRIIDWVKSIC